jgi:hypothetical protein
MDSRSKIDLVFISWLAIKLMIDTAGFIFIIWRLKNN